MLNNEANVGTVQAQSIVTLSTLNMLRFTQRLTQVTANQILVLEFSTNGSAAQSPVKPAVKAHTCHIRAVVVELNNILAAADKLKTVLIMVPPCAGVNMHAPHPVLGLQRSIGFDGMLKLVIKPGRVESVAAPVLDASTSMPVHLDVVIHETALVERFLVLHIGIQTARLAAAVSVAASVIHRQHVVPAVTDRIGPCARSRITPTARLSMSLGRCPGRRLGHDIDGTHQR